MDKDYLGPYQLIRLLGRGGMGEVHLAQDPRLNRNVALKVLSDVLAGEAEFRERFLREARSVSALNHPNITTVHEIGEADGRHYIAFEYVEGDTLDSMLATEHRLDWRRLVELALPLAEAVEYAHSKGIIHRDLKPANIVVSVLGIPKILDFGLAKTAPGQSSLDDDGEAPTLARLTQAGMVVGTISYMSPEQALGQPVDRRSDVFSFGTLLYEMACGRRAFSGDTPTQALDNLLHQEPPDVGRLCPELPSELARIIHKAIRKDPAERYQDMADLGADLRHFLRDAADPSATELAASGTDKAHAGPRGGKRGWNWKRLRAVLAVMGLALACVMVLKLVRSGPSTPPGSLAVMYFENVAEAEDPDHTGRMLASLLASELSGSAGLQIVSHQRLCDVAKRLGGEAGRIDRSVATEVARRAGVGTMVLGKVVRVGAHVLATTELVDVATGRSLSSQKAEGRSVDDVFAMAEELGRQVQRDMARSAIARNDGGAGESLTRHLTSSVEAYRAYVRGESLMQRADFEAALEQFQEAVRIDPSFALAHFRLSITARWLSEGALAHNAARRGVALVEQAPAAYRDVIRANALYQEGAYSQAIPLLEETLEQDPSLKEALYILSQIYVHSARDGNMRLAIELMERLLSQDPDLYLVYDRLALAYAFGGDLETARKRLGEWESLQPEKVQGLRSVLAVLEGHPEEALGFGQAFSWIEAPLFMASAAMMAGRWDVAERLVAYDPDEWRADHLRAWSFRNRATLDVYLGRFDDAVASYLEAGRAMGFRVHEGASGGVPASALQSLAELLALRGDLRGAREQTERALALQPESARCLYYAGRFALKDADRPAAENTLETLSALPAASTSESIRMYRTALEAEIELYRGNLQRARSLLRDLVSGQSLLIDWPSACSSAGAVLRESLARAHMALGEQQEAEHAWEDLLASGFERVDQPVTYVHALYALGLLKMKRGDGDAARRLLGRFADHWGGADWTLPQVAEAKLYLKRLGGR